MTRMIEVCEVTEFGDPDVLRPAQRRWPVAGEGELVVEITAAGVNPTDLSARSGAALRRMPDLEPPFVPAGTWPGSSRTPAGTTATTAPAIRSSG